MRWSGVKWAVMVRQVTWLATHWAGCILYYIALQEGLSEHTWLQIKPDFVASLSSFERWAAPMPCLLRARQGFTAVQQGTSRFFVCCVRVIVWYTRASAETTQYSLLRTQVHLVCVLEHHNTVYRGLRGLEPHNALRNGFCGSLHALCEHPYSYHAAVRFSLEHSKHVFYWPYRQ